MTIKRELSQYEWVKLKALKAYEDGQLEKALDFAYVAASYAWKVHLGLWYDEDLENMLSATGKKIGEKAHSNKLPNGERDYKVAHIATNLYDIGGHSRVVKQWINMLSGTCKQCLYITNTGNSPSKVKWLKDLTNKGVKIRNLPYNGFYSNRIEQMIKYLEEDLPETVILHIHPNDVVTVAALNGLKKKPYVLFFNHADHVFWLGRSITDILVEWRSESVKYSKKYRKIDNTSLIPLTTDIEVKKTPKEETKKRYGIPINTTVSVSVGPLRKVLPDLEWNYFKTIEEMLKKYPNNYHIFVGIAKKIVEKELSRDPDIRKRFIMLNATPNLQPVYSIADFLIETFPVVGGSVRVEAMAHKLPIVASHNKNFSLFSDTDALPPHYPFIAETRKEVVEYSSKLINDERLRNELGRMLHNYYMHNCDYKKIKDLVISIIIPRKPQKPPSLKECWYDPEYVYECTKASTSISLNQMLIKQGVTKESSFSIKEFMEFYSNSIKTTKEISGNEFIKVSIWVLKVWLLYKVRGMLQNEKQTTA